MRRLAVALCIAVVLSAGLPAHATAVSVERTWSVGIDPFGVTLDPATGKLYVATSNRSTTAPQDMWIIDPSGPMDPTTSLIHFPSSQSMTVLDGELNRLFVPLNNRTLAIVDAATRETVATIPNAGGPGIALDPSTHRVYNTSFYDYPTPSVAIIDGATGAVLARRSDPHTTGFWWGLAQDPVRHRVYVASGDGLDGPSLDVLDDSDLSIIGSIRLPATPRFALSVDVARGLVYVGGFSSWFASAGSLYAIDEDSLQIVSTLDVGAGFASSFSTTLVPSSNTLYVSNIVGSAGNIVTVDTSTFTVVGRLALDFQPGQSVLHPDGRLYVAGYNASLLAAITFANTAPKISSISFSPVAPTSTSVLTANAQIFDPDGDPFAVSYEWRRNGVVIAGAFTPTLDLSLPDHGDRGDTLSLLVTASDGTHTASRSGSVVVGDALPTLSVSLSSTAPLTNDILVANPSASDADGDTVVLSYAWARNGSVIQGATGPSLDLRQYGDRNDVLTVSVSADDGHGGITAAHATATVADSAPAVTLALSPASPRTYETIYATATLSDPDGDAVCCVWYFKVNGTIVWQVSGQHGETSKWFDLFQPGMGDRGDTITIEVIAGDGELEAHATASAVVVNSPPFVGVALSDYSPTKKDVLVAYGSVLDFDGDTGLLITYTWKVGQKTRLVVGPTDAATSTFDLRDLQQGDVVSVTVSSFDGFDLAVPSTATARLSSR